MSQMQIERVQEIIREHLLRPEVSAVCAQVFGQFRSTAQVMLLGGTLRDVVLREFLGLTKKSRDIDFIVFGLSSDEELKRCLQRYESQSRTSFGGVKLRIEGIKVDIWRAEQQMEVAGHPAPHTEICTPQEALKYVTLTSDAIGYHLGDDALYESGFYRAIAQREIDLGERSRWLAPWIPYHLAHLASVWEATKFSLSPRVLSRVREHISPPILAQATEYLKERKQLSDAERIIAALVKEAQADLLPHEAVR